MQERENLIQVWQPVEFSEKWLKTDTSLFDELAPSWFEKRKSFKPNSKEYDDFLGKLKRQHAIETGIIEKLYDLSEGITQTFIKEGFIESYIGHKDTNISPTQLMSYLRDHSEAIDFVFDVVKNQRPLTKSFILELHQLILQHQEYTWAIDSLGNPVKVSVLKGKFKEHPNNPKREDGSVYIYCPPLQVESEIDNLLHIFNIRQNNTHPIILTAWFHHAFTQIHPFQDGNGRMARLLSTLILVKNDLFPLNVLRNERTEYIKALEEADKGFPDSLVHFFCKIQRRNIEEALNIQIQPDSLTQVAEILKEKIQASQSKQNRQRIETIEKNRNLLTNEIYHIIGKIQVELFKVIPMEQANIKTTSSDEKKYYYYTEQIIEYAKEHNYFFNKNLYRRWYRVSFSFLHKKRYDIIITIHHFGYSDSTIAIGAFMEFLDKTNEKKIIKQTIPIKLKPYIVSLENELTENSKRNIETYLRDVLKVGMSIIINELTYL
ncbi:MAG: Fic family protein [Raineya sp.]|nr:Fic family protein [Raineya sp.]